MNTNDTTDRNDTAAGTTTGSDQRDEALAAPDAAAEPTRRLVRLEDGAPGAGVAAGIGAYLGIDPVLVRLAFVVLAFAGGVGLLLYVACWIAMPSGTPEDLAGTPPVKPEQATRWAGIGLVMVAVVLVLAQAPFLGPQQGAAVLWAIALIALGVMLFRYDASQRERRESGQTSAGDAPPSGAGSTPPGGTATTPPGGTATTPPGGAAATPPGGAAATPPGGGRPGPTPAPRPPEPSPPPSILGRVAVGLALLALGVVALLDNLGVFALDASHYVAVGLVVTGVALVVGAWWGRARGLIAVGLLLVPVLVATSLFGSWTMRGLQVGERFHQPEAIEELRDEYRMFAGVVHLDLTELDADDETVVVDAQVAMGELIILVPDEANVTVQGEALAGELRLLDTIVAGVRIVHEERDEVDGATATFEIDATTVFGRIQVVRPDDAPTDFGVRHRRNR